MPRVFDLKNCINIHSDLYSMNQVSMVGAEYDNIRAHYNTIM
jgi:hypothetical protein